MRRALFVPVVTLVAALLLAGSPVTQAQSDDLAVAGQHVIEVQRPGPDAGATVIETILFTNQGDTNFTGTIPVDLDPDATLSAYFYVDGARAPLPDGGVANREPVPTEPAGDHVRHTFDLAADSVAFPPGATRGIRIEYTLPDDDMAFTRGFTQETPLLLVVVDAPPGLRPESEATPFEPLGTAWAFRLSADSNGPFQAGEAVAFDWVESPVAMRALAVGVTSTGADDALRLRAEVTGGIPPYTVSWDLDGDDECDDEETVTSDIARVTMDASGVGTHRATVCVADSAAPPGQVTQSYETRTTEAAPTTTSPTAWVLGAVGLVVGFLLMYGLVAGGMVGGRTRTTSGSAGRTGPSFGAESRNMLELRQRVMVASLKELEIAKKKGEVPEGLYTPLKSELKQDTVRVMRELEKRKTETV